MTSLTFFMTPQEYYLGWKFKRKQNQNASALFSFLSVAAACVFFGIYIYLPKEVYLLITAVLLAMFPVFTIWMERRTVKAEYDASPILNGTHTLRLYENGIEFLGSFEKIFAPWQSLQFVKETGNYLMIIPCQKSGIFVINKVKFAGAELNAVLSALHEKAPVFGGTA